VFRVAARLVTDTLLVGSLMFAAAETLRWWYAWILLAAMLFVRGVSAVVVARVSPALLLERAGLPVHREQPIADRVLVLTILATGFLGLPTIAALDHGHWHVGEPPALSLRATGLLLFVLGWGLKGMALRANAFATTVLRHQTERGHAVVDTGVYSFVRHPFYAADPLIYVGLGLWLGSWVTVALAALPVTLMLLRLRLEERFLVHALPAYGAYIARVPYRLVPGIW